MKTIETYIESKKAELQEHPFFKTLESLKSLEEISYFVPELTFWAMTFQDILRLNEERVQDPFLKKVARHHRLEDAGHEKWFLEDKKYMGKSCKDNSCSKDSIAWLYSKESQITRDAAYAILAEIYKIEDEILSVVLVLTLESSGHIFFNKVVDQVKKTGEDQNLKYFSSSHLEVEMAHAIFEEEMERKVYERKLSVSTRRKALKMIDNCYIAFNSMFDGLLQACNHRLEQAEQRKQQNAANAVEYTANQAV